MPVHVGGLGRGARPPRHEGLDVGHRQSYDNAVMERVFGSLKDELGIGEALRAFEEARDLIGNWIEIDYNPARPHSALGYWTPAAFEDSFLGAPEDAP